MKIKARLFTSGFIHVLAGVVALLWLFPYAWMTLTSFKSFDEIIQRPTALLPGSPNLSAYREVFSQVPVGRYMLITLWVATAIALIQIALALPAGYALAKLRFRGNGLAFGLVLACLLIPTQMTFVPIFLMFSKLRLVNSLTSLILPFGASALGTFMVRQALLSVPDEVIEAARLDGASEFTIVYRVLAPMLKPTLIAIFLVSFVFHYNDYFWPLVMTTDDSVRTLPLGIALLREPGTGVRWDVVMAGNVILSLPMIALFSVSQRYLILGLTKR